MRAVHQEHAASAPSADRCRGPPCQRDLHPRDTRDGRLARLALRPDAHPPDRLVRVGGRVRGRQSGWLRLLRRVPHHRGARLGRRHHLVRGAPGPLALTAIGQAIHPPASPLVQSFARAPRTRCAHPAAPEPPCSVRPAIQAVRKGFPAAQRRCAPLRRTELHRRARRSVFREAAAPGLHKLAGRTDYGYEISPRLLSGRVRRVV
jgi:hypothetical protein